MAYVIGVDCGTSGTKTVLFREDGTVMASATIEYPMYQPKNGYAEQDPADWKDAMIRTIQTVVTKSGVSKEEIKGIGISGQMHGLVMLDKDNNVLRKSIIWCDQRTAAEVDEMNRVVGREKLMEITANPALTGWTAAKILWVRNNEPDVYEKCRHILLPKDCEYAKWSVVACDQYTSQPEYWQRVEERVGRAPSSLRLILPESCLDGPSVETDIMEINNTMSRYLREERFALLPQTMIYVERTLHNGKLRRGLVGMVDLEQYDWTEGTATPVRASTTMSRAPRPRCGPPRAPSSPVSRPEWRCGRTPPLSCLTSCSSLTIRSAPSSSPWPGRRRAWSRSMTSI